MHIYVYSYHGNQSIAYYYAGNCLAIFVNPRMFREEERYAYLINKFVLICLYTVEFESIHHGAFAER